MRKFLSPILFLVAVLSGGCSLFVSSLAAQLSPSGTGVLDDPVGWLVLAGFALSFVCFAILVVRLFRGA